MNFFEGFNRFHAASTQQTILIVYLGLGMHWFQCWLLIPSLADLEGSAVVVFIAE